MFILTGGRKPQHCQLVSSFYSFTKEVSKVLCCSYLIYLGSSSPQVFPEILSPSPHLVLRAKPFRLATSFKRGCSDPSNKSPYRQLHLRTTSESHLAPTRHGSPWNNSHTNKETLPQSSPLYLTSETVVLTFAAVLSPSIFLPNKSAKPGKKNLFTESTQTFSWCHTLKKYFYYL